jgi:hypothetical protein
VTVAVLMRNTVVAAGRLREQYREQMTGHL